MRIPAYGDIPGCPICAKGDGSIHGCITGIPLPETVRLPLLHTSGLVAMPWNNDCGQSNHKFVEGKTKIFCEKCGEVREL